MFSLNFAGFAGGKPFYPTLLSILFSGGTGASYECVSIDGEI